MGTRIMGTGTFIHKVFSQTSQWQLEHLAGSNKYYGGEGKKRHLWLATRMGMPTVKDAPGIEIVQTYNLLTHDQIAGMGMKKMV